MMGLINLLPVPGLDGGQLFLFFLPMAIQMGGLLVVFGLIAYIYLRACVSVVVLCF